MNTLNNKEYIELLNHLDARHGLFYHLWDMGIPVFSAEIDTARVVLSEDGECLEFMFNEEFWKSLTLERKIFVICHECLHVTLNHGHRLFKNAKDLEDAKLINYATDVVINHTLVEKFGMVRENIDPNTEYCWLDTVFPDQEIAERKSSEFYYSELKNKASSNSDLKTVDEHPQFSNSGKSEESGEDMKPIMEKVNDLLAEGEQDFIKEILNSNAKLDDMLNNAGASPGSIFTKVNTGNKQVKRKWESVIHKWASRFLIEKDKIEMQWTRINRRFALISGSDMFIPSEMEVEDTNFEKRKIDVWFFQDTSYSCVDHAQRFFDAAKSLPTDRFNMRLFCFDTEVYETSLASGKLYGFGGTTFNCIERRIQEIISTEKCEYPRAVFVITDGFGDWVTPQMPSNWYWFLTANGETRYIPSKSHIYNLENYE